MSRRNRRPAAVALAAGITVLLLASATAGGAQTGAPQHGTGVTATSITVAGLGDASVYGGADLGARARFQRANDAGGVHGRTVDYAGFTDDGGDPTAGTSAATALVQQRQVFAVVPAVTPDFAAGRFLAGRKVPYFGWGLSSGFCGNDYGFGFSGCLVPEGVTSNAWGVLVSKVFGAQSVGRTAARNRSADQ